MIRADERDASARRQLTVDIDFVVLWVDGSDPAWLAEKEKYEPESVLPDGGKNRWRDWGLMPYWFRSVEQYAPWVNKVYFVTWGHLPAFLNPEAPKLKIVKHADFMPEEYLPSFNSCSNSGAVIVSRRPSKANVALVSSIVLLIFNMIPISFKLLLF